MKSENNLNNLKDETSLIKNYKKNTLFIATQFFCQHCKQNLQLLKETELQNLNISLKTYSQLRISYPKYHNPEIADKLIIFACFHCQILETIDSYDFMIKFFLYCIKNISNYNKKNFYVHNGIITEIFTGKANQYH